MIPVIYVQSIDCVLVNSLRATVHINLANDHLFYNLPNKEWDLEINTGSTIYVRQNITE